jgi:uncharacterized protein (TIGR02145 family)
VADVGTNKFFVYAGSWRVTNSNNDDPYANPDVNPCPANWVVPSREMWGSAFMGSTTTGNADVDPSFNKWVRVGTGSSIGASPATDVISLFIPAAGTRNPDGTVTSVGTNWRYWCSDTILQWGTARANISGFQASINFGSLHGATGLSLRCVAP